MSVMKDFGEFVASTKGPSLRTYREREIEDLGSVGVYWYRRPTGHTKTASRHHGETPMVIEWAYVRNVNGAWAVGSARPGFADRNAAVEAARIEVEK